MTIPALRAWGQANLARRAIEVRIRRGVNPRVVPGFVDYDRMNAIYREARALSASTGIDHHVDHVVPLKGSNVTGLHVSWNLQVIPKASNLRKGNQHSADFS